MDQEQLLVRRARGITYELEGLGEYIEKISDERRLIVRQLVEKHGWSQHQVAAALQISQPAVHKILEVKD